MAAIKEKSDSCVHITERHLQVMWLEQKYFSLPATECGKEVEVLSPGLWNTGPGPDFLRAHLRIGEKEARGDIEIHLRSEEWYHHHHNSDSRYDNVILHVCLWKSSEPRQAMTSSGDVLSNLYLENTLTVSLKRIFQLIDLDLYPYKRFGGSGRCAEELYSHCSSFDVSQIFEGAALWRLERKRMHLLYWAKSEDEALVAGIAMSLGYRNNAQSFLELFLILKSHAFREVEQLHAIALGACGFFKEEYKKRWGSSEEYQKLLSLWTSSVEQPHPLFNLTTANIRPYNHPVRRLYALAQLVADNNTPLLFSKMISIWERDWQTLTTKKVCKALHNDLSETIPQYENPHWNHHYTFELLPQQGDLSLLGAGLKQEMVINAFFPLLYHTIRQQGSKEELYAFKKYYRSLTAIPSKKGKYLRQRFFGEKMQELASQDAMMQQGSYQIHHHYCTHYEASCRGCPFVSDIQSPPALTYKPPEA
ncbi:DUF2851 family protein [Simkania negevensis]|uniref:DUF2851 family protein n=1 Tax=Simkania negevensis TaxID=83561 RepID=A0ABS3ARH8_9BACT|nr:DUF2851 family protein [Simkania negevensis]